MYELSTEPLRQGDVIRDVPFTLELNVRAADVLSADGERITSVDLGDAMFPEDHKLVIAPEFSLGLLLNQDCDIGKAKYLTFARISPLADVPAYQQFPAEHQGKHGRLPTEADTAKWIMDSFTGLGTFNSLFYLTPSPALDMPASVANLFHLQAYYVKKQGPKDYFAARRILSLSDSAQAHLQARISVFFGRYAFERRYVLTAEERAAYDAEYPGR